MKKIIFASAVVASVAVGMDAMAANTTVCAGAPTAGNSANNISTATSGVFVKTDVTSAKCSANVHLVGSDLNNGAAYGVGAVSVKGKNVFQGSTAGGGVRGYTTCATAGACAASEANTAATNAPS